jgi:hypothetical protein
MRPMFSLLSGWTRTFALAFVLMLTACADKDEARPARTNQPLSAFEGIVPGTSVDEHDFPLLTHGPDGVSFMTAVRDNLSQGSGAGFEIGFRLAFCADKSLRDYDKAVNELSPLAEETPHPGLLRTLAWSRYHAGETGDPEGLYQPVFAVDAGHGESHYDLAFLLAIVDRKKGAEHFASAKQASIEDTRNLEERFYSQE